MSLIRLNDVSIRFENTQILREAFFRLEPGDRVRNQTQSGTHFDGKADQPVGLARINQRIGDRHVAHPAFQKDGRLGEFGFGKARSTRADLQFRDPQRFVGLICGCSAGPAPRAIRAA